MDGKMVIHKTPVALVEHNHVSSDRVRVLFYVMKDMLFKVGSAAVAWSITVSLRGHSLIT